MKTIVSTTSSFCEQNPDFIEMLEKRDYGLIKNPFCRKLTEAEVLSFLLEHRPVGLLGGTEPITRPVLDKAKEFLKVISRVGVGWDNVDRTSAYELGIKVYRTEGVLSHAVAELTLGLMLSAFRLIVAQDRQIRANVWQKRMGNLLQGKTVGIIGFGAIGRRVGQLVTAFGAKVVYFDPVPKEGSFATPVSLVELLGQADVISIHADGSKTILGENELINNCKKGVIVINTARGGLVDEKALHKALTSGGVSFACLDVFENEPYCGPLCYLDNVILTPHIGSYALEARVAMEMQAMENLLEGLKIQ